MQRSPIEPSGQSDATRSVKAQWSLQSLFYFMLIAAVGLAVLAPFFRAWTPQQRFTLVVIALIELATVMIAGYWCWRTRNRVLRDAGDCFFRTSFRTRKATTWRSLLPIGLNVFVLIAMQVISISMLSSQSNSWLATLSILAGQISPMVITAARFWSLIWGVDELDVELCDHGMITGAYGLLTWENLAEVRPSELRDDTIVRVVKSGGLKTTGAILVSKEVRDDILERIQEQIRLRP